LFLKLHVLYNNARHIIVALLKDSNMTQTAMTLRERAAAKWQAVKPVAIALAIGLVSGPLISNYVGWQVTSGTARAQMHAGIVEQQAAFCDVNARAEVKDPGKLDWSARNDLAKKWAIMPGQTSAESDVAYACAGKLAA
jgi:hypothetical protein